MANGILPLYKPAGITSMEAIRRIKRATHDPKIGHGGTLDPFAEGLLPIFFGNASRTMEYLIDGAKGYRAEAMLGGVMDTYDVTGELTLTGDTCDPTHLTRDEVEAVLQKFRGTIMQVPPMFSALKRQGRPLYELAREGYETERAPRKIEIHRLEITDWTPPTYWFEVDCGRGTYVRSLAHDIGQALGCGAYLTRLIRTKSGPFTLADAVQLSDLEQAVAEGRWQSLLAPTDAPLTKFLKAVVKHPAAIAITQGKQVKLDMPSAILNDELCRAYLEDGTFMALLKHEKASNMWQPIKVFVPVMAEKANTAS